MYKLRNIMLTLISITQIVNSCESPASGMVSDEVVVMYRDKHFERYTQGSLSATRCVGPTMGHKILCTQNIIGKDGALARIHVDSSLFDCLKAKYETQHVAGK